MNLFVGWEVFTKRVKSRDIGSIKTEYGLHYNIGNHIKNNKYTKYESEEEQDIIIQVIQLFTDII